MTCSDSIDAGQAPRTNREAPVDRQFNAREQLPLRQALRNNATTCERLLWRRLKGSRLGSHKFRRQQGIGPYIVDFYCPAAKLVVELDGSSHHEPEQVEHDQVRTAYLTTLGLRVMRFGNEQVRENLDGVVAALETVLGRGTRSADE